MREVDPPRMLSASTKLSGVSNPCALSPPLCVVVSRDVEEGRRRGVRVVGAPHAAAASLHA